MATLDDLIAGVTTLRNTMTGALFIEDRGPSDYTILVRNDQPVSSGSAQNQIEGVSVPTESLTMRRAGDIEAQKLSDLVDHPTMIDADVFIVETGGVLKKLTAANMATTIAQKVWDLLEANVTTPNSIGLKLKNNLDVAVSTRSSHSAAAVWSSATRTLTSFGTLITDIWGYVTRTLTGTVTTDAASRTASQADVSNLDAAVSSRSSHIAADVKDAVFNEVIDVETFRKLFTALVATTLGQTSKISDTQFAFKKRDGTTTLVTINYGAAAGERDSSVIA